MKNLNVDFMRRDVCDYILNLADNKLFTERDDTIICLSEESGACMLFNRSEYLQDGGMKMAMENAERAGLNSPVAFEHKNGGVSLMFFEKADLVRIPT